MSRVLVVDADPGVLYWAKTWLQSEGLELDVALTGLQGLELARRQPPDVILLDAQIALREPEALAKLCQMDEGLVILLTPEMANKSEGGASRRDAATAGSQDGVFDRVAKPLDLRRLREVVERALETSHRRPPARPPNLLDGSTAALSAGSPEPETDTASSSIAVRDPHAFVTPLAEFARELLGQQAPQLYRRIHREVDRVVLHMILRSVNGNQVKASEMLGISRTTLRSKLRGLRRQDSRHSS